MADTIDLREKVVAIFDQEESARAAVHDLVDNGYDVEVLQGEEGRRRLDPHEEEGFFASLGHALQTVVGDEDRIVDDIDAYLAEDRSLVVVGAEEAGEEESAADILRRHGGHYMWRFDQWTYVPLGGE